MVRKKKNGNYRKDKSTILLDKEVINLLKEAKEYERQTYNELIKKITELFVESKRAILTEEKINGEKEKKQITNAMTRKLSSETQ